MTSVCELFSSLEMAPTYCSEAGAPCKEHTAFLPEFLLQYRLWLCRCVGGLGACISSMLPGDTWLLLYMSWFEQPGLSPAPMIWAAQDWVLQLHATYVHVSELKTPRPESHSCIRSSCHSCRQPPRTIDNTESWRIKGPVSSVPLWSILCTPKLMGIACA